MPCGKLVSLKHRIPLRLHIKPPRQALASAHPGGVHRGACLACIHFGTCFSPSMPFRAARGMTRGQSVVPDAGRERKRIAPRAFSTHTHAAARPETEGTLPPHFREGRLPFVRSSVRKFCMLRPGGIGAQRALQVLLRACSPLGSPGSEPRAGRPHGARRAGGQAPLLGIRRRGPLPWPSWLPCGAIAVGARWLW